MSSSDEKEHQIGCESHQCHHTHDNNKKEFDSSLGFNFAINLRPKSPVNDRKTKHSGSQMMAKTTRTCVPTDPSKVCKFCLTIYKDLDLDMFCMNGGQGN